MCVLINSLPEFLTVWQTVHILFCKTHSRKGVKSNPRCRFHHVRPLLTAFFMVGIRLVYAAGSITRLVLDGPQPLQVLVSLSSVSGGDIEHSRGNVGVLTGGG